MGFVAGLANGERAIMRSTGGPAVVIWSSSLALPSVVTGGESTMGISASGGFIYSPSTDGRDSVHTHAGLLMAADDVAVGVPGRFITFCSRPRMTGNGTAYWVSGTAVSVGGASSGRVFYRSTNPADPLQTVALWVSGDAFAPGLTIGTSGVGFDYDCSENGEHRIHELLAAGASTATDECVWADGIVLAREGSPAPDGTNWGVFQGMGINNSGVTIFAADTSGPTTSDQVLVLNGSIVLREGESLAGRVLGSAVSALAIDNGGNAVFIWTTPAETLFYRAADGVSTALLTVGDQIDVNGDSVSDYSVADFNASGSVGPGLDLADSGPISVHVDLTPLGGGTNLAAVIGLARPGQPGCVADFNGDGEINADDLGDYINCYFAIPPCGQADFNSDGDVNADDLGDYINVFFQGC